MPRRNVKGTGSRPTRWRDRWRAYLTVGHGPDGRVKRAWVYGRTADECQEKLDALRGQRRQGGLSPAEEPATLADWIERWLAHTGRRVKPRTVTIYQDDLRHLPGGILRRRVDRVTPAHVEDALATIMDAVSPRAAAMTRKRLVAVYRYVMRHGAAARNPAEVVEAILHRAAPAQVWTAEEVVRFVQVTREARAWYHALFYAALATGARMGELFALQWGDVDGDSLMIERTLTGHGKDRVAGPPKTRAGRRRLPISRDLAATLEAQRAMLAVNGLPTGPRNLVFPSDEGTALRHTNVRRALHGWAKQAGVPAIRPHDLRHTFASMAIAAGMSPADLARQLGHSDASFTLRQYVHFFERAKPRPALSLADLAGVAEGELDAIGGTERGTAPEVVS